MQGWSTPTRRCAISRDPTWRSTSTPSIFIPRGKKSFREETTTEAAKTRHVFGPEDKPVMSSMIIVGFTVQCARCPILDKSTALILTQLSHQIKPET